MNEWQTFWTGIAPEHAAALIVTVLLPGVWWLHRALTTPATASDRAPLSLTDRWIIGLLAATAAIHLGLPLGHHDSGLLTVGFLGSGAAYAWLAVRVYRGRSWRLLTSLLVVGTLVAYLAVIAGGGEEPDQVGIATALVELMLLGFALTPARPRRVARGFGSAATLLAIFIVGTITWAGAFRAHEASDLDAGLPEVPAAGAAIETAHEHGHDHSARAQAGVIMRPLGEGHHPTAQQVRAAAELAKATKAATARFADPQVALDAGYRSETAMTGVDVHLENKAYADDGHVLDPERPEALVYAITDGKATLLGAVFRMPRAGTPGPEPGGPITRWHSHNICFSVLPPGIGVVSPFGGCPALSVTVTISEMMHVWTVDNNPGGPYVEGLDAAWIRTYHAQHGTPWPAA